MPDAALVESKILHRV